MNGEIIGRYHGEYTWASEVRNHQQEIYCFEINGCKIYPADSCVLKFINDNVLLDNKGRKIGRHKMRHNVSFETVEDYVFVCAIEDIEAGEELYISYGPGYWLEA
jgi:hypothetical protein